MNKNIYSIYDTKAQFFRSILILRTKGEAVRVFTELANDKQTDIGKNPEDYVMYKIGEFDEIKGEITRVEKESIGMASEYVKQ